MKIEELENLGIKWDVSAVDPERQNSLHNMIWAWFFFLLFDLGT